MTFLNAQLLNTPAKSKLTREITLFFAWSIGRGMRRLFGPADWTVTGRETARREGSDGGGSEFRRDGRKWRREF